MAFLHALLDLVLPLDCAGCRGSGGPLCATCLTELAGEPRSAWPCPVPPGLPEPFAAGAYGGVRRSAVIAYKERGQRRLAPALADALAGAVTGAVAAACDAGAPGPYLLTPIPSRRAALIRRGDDTTARLARLAAARVRSRGIGASVVTVLRHVREVADQAGLGGPARLANLAGALAVPYAWEPLVAGQRVVLIDDVLTTGATLAEAARALRKAGADVVAAATVAAVEPLTDSRTSRNAADLPLAALQPLGSNPLRRGTAAH